MRAALSPLFPRWKDKSQFLNKQAAPSILLGTASQVVTSAHQEIYTAINIWKSAFHSVIYVP